MNRAPSERDFWWPKHVQICGGTYVKIKEPDGFQDKKKPKPKSKPGKDIRSYFPPNSLSGGPGDAQRSAAVNGRKVVKGISNPGSQSVGRVGVQNAINANVNGFGASKKSGNPGTGVRGGVASGSKGSRTVVVKGKKGVGEKGRTESANDPPSFVPFSGGSHSLGSANP
ncbi:UNVERIFIED_CONTAM: hypothetical protein GTU68_029649, partial [Idotea baltica]|nr:hypothetical protein [Idotea baltica]